jgi:hypothetical protein
MTETEDLIAAIKSEPPGTFKLYRATEEQPEVEQAMANLGELAARVQHARSVGCLIEVVSLRMQYLDIWLRVFYENRPHEAPRQREFGRLLRQCFDVGLEKDIYDQILKFNDDRVRAIHGYLVGRIGYNELDAVVAESDGLSERLAVFVLENAGEVVTPAFETQWHNRGDIVRHIPRSLTLLCSRQAL